MIYYYSANAPESTKSSLTNKVFVIKHFVAFRFSKRIPMVFMLPR